MPASWKKRRVMGSIRRTCVLRRSISSSEWPSAYVSNPVGQAKSVVFSQQGLREAERLLHELFEAEEASPR
jgi:hypothetical protein